MGLDVKLCEMWLGIGEHDGMAYIEICNMNHLSRTSIMRLNLYCNYD